MANFFWLIGDRINGVPLYILFQSRQKPTIIVSDTITLDNFAVQQVEVTKFLGVLLGTDRSPITITMGSWDGPLEISGGGVTIPKKKFLQGKLVQKKILPHI